MNPALKTSSTAGVRTLALEELRWRALRRRDEKADGSFWYGVRTTGVYCRPSCAAKQAKRENVRFFADCEEAERAGFRPCKRCRPKGKTLAERQRDCVRDACRSMERAEAMPSLAALAAQARMSSFHFHRIFKALTG